jgi:hypothetical protein
MLFGRGMIRGMWMSRRVVGWVTLCFYCTHFTVLSLFQPELRRLHISSFHHINRLHAHTPALSILFLLYLSSPSQAPLILYLPLDTNLL